MSAKDAAISAKDASMSAKDAAMSAKDTAMSAKTAEYETEDPKLRTRPQTPTTNSDHESRDLTPKCRPYTNSRAPLDRLRAYALRDLLLNTRRAAFDPARWS